MGVGDEVVEDADMTKEKVATKLPLLLQRHMRKRVTMELEKQKRLPTVLVSCAHVMSVMKLDTYQPIVRIASTTLDRRAATMSGKWIISIWHRSVVTIS